MHGTPWASRNWDEFGDMIGAKSAPHRIEQGIMRVYDPASPIVKPFGGKPLNFREEYYRFKHDGPNRLRWEDVRVLLTVDLDDPKVEPRPWNGYKRPDNVYPVTWIRSYGKGRSFYSLARTHDEHVHHAGNRRALPGGDAVPDGRPGCGHHAESPAANRQSGRREARDKMSTQFLIVSRRWTERFAEADFAARAEAERAQARALYAEGFIRQIWQRGDIPGACILVEAESEEHVRERLNTLPLYEAGMIEFTVIALKPYAGFGPPRT